LVLIHVRAVQRLLACVGPTGANDSNDVFLSLRVDDDHESLLDGTDRDEAILEFGVLAVEDLQVSTPDSKSLRAATNETPCFS
jgi:hypothetical protein